MNALAKAIGGYFELELPVFKNYLYHDALTFQSARAAFYALLDVGKPQRVWMPKYICNSMLSPLWALNIEIVFYDLVDQFEVADNVVLNTGDWLVYVNYFGICDEQERNLLNRFNSSQLIFDHSQAFYAPPLESLATIYSPRKFFGIPDGGLLFTQLLVTEPNEVDKASISRCTHLLKRLGGEPEIAYDDFKQAETSLALIQPRRMSCLTNRMLAGIDYNIVRNKRNANFLFLHEKLMSINQLKINSNTINAPMCYPLLITDKTIRQRLLKNRVFVAIYWTDVRERISSNSLEYKLLENCLPIPCDQRYDTQDLENILYILNDSGVENEY